MLLVFLAAWLLQGGPVNAAETILVGVPDRLSKASIELADAMLADYSRFSGDEVRVLVLPLERMKRDFASGRLDVRFYASKDSSFAQTRYPVSINRLLLVRMPDALQYSVKELARPEIPLAMPKNSEASQLINRTDAITRVDGIEQGLRLVAGGRVAGYAEWMSELQGRVGLAALRERGFALQTLIDNVTMHPTMLPGSSKLAFLDRFDAWLLSACKDGTLHRIFVDLDFEHHDALTGTPACQ